MAQSLTLPTLHLDHFRSHRARIVPLANPTVLIGPNGVGKTNLLEAIWYLATTRSFRTSHDNDLVRWGASGAVIRGGDFEARIALDPLPRKVFTIRGMTRRPLDYLGELRAVLFTPDSLAILTGSPRDRRRFLDTLLAQGDRACARDLVAYRRVVTERNALLRLIRQGRAGQGELAPWDIQLVALGSRLTRRRRELLSALAVGAAEDYQRLSGRKNESLKMVYRATAAEEPGAFLGQLERAFAREVLFQATMIGPHRDDFLVEIAERSLAEYGSRGEIRTALLALKWAEYRYLAQGQDTQPIFLLDDLFSELDREHRETLGKFLAETQAVITTTDRDHLPEQLWERAAVVELTYQQDEQRVA